MKNYITLYLTCLLLVTSCSTSTTDPIGVSELSTTAYERSEFGASWIDDNSDGQNTRAEILISQSTISVTFTDNSNTIVDTGSWVSIFTSAVVLNANEVDIDHIVPLQWAWLRGADLWEYEMRVEFANNTHNLAIVELGLNRSKGAQGPLDWLPPLSHCGYVSRFITIYTAYGLTPLYEEVVSMDALQTEVCADGYVITDDTTTDFITYDGVIKQSTAGLCHQPGTTYYDQTVSYEPFSTIDECIEAGGVLPN